MFALELGGEYGWGSSPIIGLFASFLVFFISFFFFEKRAKDPIISLWLFKRRLFATSQILAILYGGTFIILTVYIPIFVQAVYGGSATNAGLILTPMMLGSVVRQCNWRDIQYKDQLPQLDDDFRRLLFCRNASIRDNYP